METFRITQFPIRATPCISSALPLIKAQALYTIRRRRYIINFGEIVYHHGFAMYIIKATPCISSPLPRITKAPCAVAHGACFTFVKSDFILDGEPR